MPVASTPTTRRVRSRDAAAIPISVTISCVESFVTGVSRRIGQLAREKGHEQDAVFRTAQRELRSFPVARIRR